MFWQELSRNSQCTDEAKEAHKSYVVSDQENDMQLPQPAITRLCSNKNCQCTRCYKKKNYEKNCQSYVKSVSEGTMLFSYVDSNGNK